jgi:hypothetical protein
MAESPLALTRFNPEPTGDGECGAAIRRDAVRATHHRFRGPWVSDASDGPKPSLIGIATDEGWLYRASELVPRAARWPATGDHWRSELAVGETTTRKGRKGVTGEDRALSDSEIRLSANFGENCGVAAAAASHLRMKQQAGRLRPKVGGEPEIHVGCWPCLCLGWWRSPSRRREKDKNIKKISGRVSTPPPFARLEW